MLMLKNNKNSMKFLLFLSLIAVVVVSGCNGTSTTGTGPGVSILEFTPDFTQVFSDEKVKLQLKVQNLGEAKAENVRAEITGIDIDEWRGFGVTFAQKELGDLIAYDSATTTPGEVKTVQWSDLYAPTLAKGIEFTYAPIVRVSYDYETKSIKKITLVDADELRSIQQRGGTLPSESTQYSAGPLSVEIKTGDYVKTSGMFGDTYDIFPIYIKIINTEWEGGGSVMPETFLGFGDEDYPVHVEITPPSGTNFVFSGFGQDCGSSMVVDLWKGKDAEITCELEVTNPPTIRQDGLITVDLEYRYRIDATTQITVIGTEEGGGFF
jgi:hypothetical protein